jgi:pimeloyl-ACP methyl ester carboxylesterase
MWLVKLSLVLAGIYAALILVAYFLQSWLIFPAGLVSGGSNLASSARIFNLNTPDGEHIVLVQIPPSRTPTEQRPLLLGFGGNAWNAEAVALLLHQIFPEHDVAAAHYRGYGPSSGRPSSKALFDDARLVFDHLASENATNTVAVGFSIGASVAVELAASRPLKGLVLVTPFYSLKELAATHYPWLPVRLLLSHRMEAASTLRGLDVPVALITARNDTIVPEIRSAPVREAVTDLRADYIIEAVGHNDIYDNLRFITALQKSVDAVVRD